MASHETQATCLDGDCRGACVCVCVCENVCMNVCVCEREREREIVFDTWEILAFIHRIQSISG